MIIDVVKVFLPSVLAFAGGIAITPILTAQLYKHKMWKKKAGKVDLSGKETVLFNELHKDREVNTPRMGGIVIWASAGLVTFVFWFLSNFFGNDIFQKIDFLSRNQTWIPLAALFFGGFIGLIDDYLEVRENKNGKSGGLSLKKRLAVVASVGLLCALWFFFKLEINSIGWPGSENGIFLGFLFIPLFIIVTLGIYSGGVIDGIDGLAGGIFASIFAAYGGIAFYQNQIDLAAFCALMVGSILAFLWFNIPPARYYMSETGTMGLTMSLAVVAFMTDKLGGGYGLLVLPVIALPLLATSLSNVLQVTSKKFRNGKKIFKIAPLHHHFEAIGWPAYKVTMRFWVFGTVCATLGMILGLIG
jgi:phospho-N-acetylmuramoyl-pentapeptide-transferase